MHYRRVRNRLRVIKFGEVTDQLALIISLVILANLWDVHICAVVRDARRGLKEDEGEWRRRAARFLDWNCHEQLEQDTRSNQKTGDSLCFA